MAIGLVLWGKIDEGQIKVIRALLESVSGVGVVVALNRSGDDSTKQELESALVQVGVHEVVFLEDGATANEFISMMESRGAIADARAALRRSSSPLSKAIQMSPPAEQAYRWQRRRLGRPRGSRNVKQVTAAIVDSSKRIVMVDDFIKTLGPSQFAFLVVLLATPNRKVSPSAIKQACWSEEIGVNSRRLRETVSQLKKSIPALGYAIRGNSVIGYSIRLKLSPELSDGSVANVS